MLLRLAEPHDALAVAQVHVRSWQEAYQGLLPDNYLAQLRAEDRASQYDFATRDPLKPRTIVALEDGQILGFATTAPSRDADLADYGELCALYVHPDRWGKGIGTALVAAARAHLFESGFRDALLWVLAGNLRAERFYRADLWTPDSQRRTQTLWGVTVDESRYLRRLAAQ